jgi:hypothetical protein
MRRSGIDRGDNPAPSTDRSQKMTAEGRTTDRFASRCMFGNTAMMHDI